MPIRFWIIIWIINIILNRFKLPLWKRRWKTADSQYLPSVFLLELCRGPHIIIFINWLLRHQWLCNTIGCNRFQLFNSGSKSTVISRINVKTCSNRFSEFFIPLSTYHFHQSIFIKLSKPNVDCFYLRLWILIWYSLNRRWSLLRHRSSWRHHPKPPKSRR